MITIPAAQIEFMEVGKFPAIFRKLDWWDKRAPNEMPTYVKLKPEFTNVQYIPVFKPDWYGDKGQGYLFDTSDNWQYGAWDIEIATEEEYIAFQQSNEEDKL